MRFAKKFILMFIAIATMISCEEKNEMLIFEEASVLAIEAEDLPQGSQDFIEENFVGEVITSAFQITTSNQSASYEAFLTNNINLVFEEDGTFQAIGDSASLVDCSGHLHRKKGGKKHKKNKFKHAELEISDIPTAAAGYISTNYPDAEIAKIFSVNKNDSIHYVVLINEVGALIFDANGTFLDSKEKRKRECGNFDSVAIADLPETITTYITSNYPDKEILRARQGNNKEGIAVIHVLINETGVLIFDTEGNFIEIKTCGLDYI